MAYGEGTLMITKLPSGRDRPDWQRHRFQEVKQGFKPASQDGDTAPTIGRHLIEGAVRDPDPENGDKRRIRVKVNCDILDRELASHRITPGQHAAGRTYQRLFEISVGAKALDGTGTADRANQRDDALVRSLERAGRVIDELIAISQIVGKRNEALLRQALCALNPNTGKSWTFEEIAEAAGYATAPRHVVYALAERFRDALDDLAERWGSVELS